MRYSTFLLTFYLLFSLSSFAQESSQLRLQRVVIDAGHGGKDPGTISIDGKVKEKDITLSVALKLGALISANYPNIDVIYTRKSDIAVPLDKRTEIANKNKADLFISIHVNGAASRAASGSETFVMGANKSQSNFEVTMLENSVILLEGDDYNTRYEGFNPNDPESYIIFTLLQNAHLEQSLSFASLVQQNFDKGPVKINRGVKQAPFLVLWKTSMPSILIELGFISNSNDLKALNKSNHNTFAQLIFEAFKEYKRRYEKEKSERGQESSDSVNREAKESTTKENIVKESSSKESEAISVSPGNKIVPNPPQAKSSHYRVQIMSVNKQLKNNSKEFKGVKEVKYIKVGALYKYTVGEYQTIEEAREGRAHIIKQFPSSFIIKVENGVIVPLQ